MPPEHVVNDNSSPPDFANVELADIIDIPALHEMMDDYYALTGISAAILDLKGTVLVSTEWQDICVNFHRAVPESCAFCHESDISLSSGVPPGTFKDYRCKNNMWDIATPIMLGDRHIGNIFLGQFLYDDEEPDYELFRAQARHFGYDEAEYLAALDRVPRRSRETVQKAMGFISKLARMISKANYSNVILADTLARKEQAEEALQLTRISVDAASDALFWVAPDAHIVDVNEAACRYLGYTREELLRLRVPDVNTRFNAEKWPQQFAELRQRGTFTFENELIAKDGRVFPVEIVANYVKVGNKELNFSFVRDITERKRAEEKLRRSEERYRRLYNDTPVMLHSIDHNGRLVSVSNYWLDTLGYKRDEVLGRKTLDFLTEESRHYAEVVVLPEFFRTGSCKDVSYKFVKKNGEILDVLLSATAERNGEGKVVRSLAVLIDVTERMRAQEEIDKLNTDLAVRAAELENVNHELEAFNYSVSHDLRKPLNIISGYCQVILELCGHNLNAQCLEYMQLINNGTMEMSQLIDTLLKFSFLMHTELHREDLDLSKAADTVAAELALTEPGRRVTFRISEGITAYGDARLLRVILENLIGNAWKYTGKQEEAVIEFGMLKVEGKQTYFVRDNGEGFDMAYADKLFIPFQRLHRIGPEGHGIGLATVERIIKRHGGKVWAESAPGKGAIFYFTL